MSSIDDIRSKAANIKSKRGEVYRKLQQLESELQDALQSIPIYAQSKRLTLQTIGIDDGLYGFLCWSSEKLAIAYRSTEEDFDDLYNNVPDEYRTFSEKELATSPIEWLELISSEDVINSLLESIKGKLENIEQQTNNYSVIDKILNTESAILSKQIAEELKALGDENLYNNWNKARNCIQTDPADSITQTCSYLEAICRKILSDLKQPQPSQKDISSLINIVIDNVNISSDSLANEELKMLLGNIKGILAAIGKLRTDFGSAHGNFPGKRQLNEHSARFINDIGGSVSSFLLNLVKEKT
jgi:hypothetical protein